MIKYLFICFVLLLNASCSSLPTASKLADEAEKIPIGLHLNEFTKQGIEWNLQNLTPNNVQYIFDAWLFIYPIDKKLYRQWPEGILLYLASSDTFVSVPVKDNKYGTGGVYVFFTSNLEFKGYFAYSNMACSKDNSERSQQEILAYQKLGFEKERSLASKRIEMRMSDGHNWKEYLPTLPLRRRLVDL